MTDRSLEQVVTGLVAASRMGWKVRDFALFMRPWLGEVRWPFPTWSARRRPFDWAIDEADIPVTSEDRWHRGDRRRFNFYLRPAEAVVRR